MIPIHVEEIMFLEYGAGTSIKDACWHALKRATEQPLNIRIVRFDFNGISMEARDGMTVEGMTEQYNQRLVEKQNKSIR